MSGVDVNAGWVQKRLEYRISDGYTIIDTDIDEVRKKYGSNI